MSDETGNDPVEEALRRYNEPPEIPREAMWAEIREALPGRGAEAEERSEGPGRRAATIPARWIWAAAALLVLGVGIGRWTASDRPPDGPGAPPTARVTAGVEEEAMAPIRQAAYRHLTATEAFLAGVRADARRGEVDPELAAWAGDLLTETRLLMDSRLADDPRMGGLLEDLELLLMQVQQAARTQDGGGGRGREELELLTRGMDESDVNLRIDAVLPAAAGTIGT